MKSTLLLSAALCTSLLTGCVIIDKDTDSGWSHSSSWQQHHKDNRAKIANLNFGDRHSKVLDDLGTPQFSEQIQKDGDTYRIFFYATSRDGDMSKDACTPLVFKNDELIGWGESAYKNVY